MNGIAAPVIHIHYLDGVSLNYDKEGFNRDKESVVEQEEEEGFIVFALPPQVHCTREVEDELNP